MNWSLLIGHKIVAFRGWKGYNKCPLSRILFDDKETYIELDEQDTYSYHDCSASARNLELYKNPEIWAEMYNKENNWGEPTDLSSPF